MRKRPAIILVIVALLVCGCVAEQIFFSRTLDAMHDKTVALQALLDENADDIVSDGTLAAADDLAACWDRNRAVYDALLSHTYTMELENKVAVLRTHLALNDYMMTATDLEGILASLDSIRTLVTPNLSTLL